MKYWEIIADNLKKRGWSLGYVSAIDSNGRTIWIVDAHSSDGQRFIWPVFVLSHPALISRVSSAPFALFPRVIRTPVFSRAYSGPATLFKRIHKIKIRQSRSEVPKIFQKAETLLRFWNSNL